MHSAPRTKTVHGLLSLLLVLPWTATWAQTSQTCPVDGVQRLTPATPQPWNHGAGIDSDGCRYSVDELGRRRVIGLTELVQCTRCRVSFLPGQLKVSLEPEERKTLEADALAAERAGAGRWEIAALTCEFMGERGAPEGIDPEAQLAEVYLRAAWAERAKAVLGGADGGYRPRTLEEARAQLEGLERLATMDPRLDPEVLRIDRLLADLEYTRQGLPRESKSASAQRRLLRSLTHMASMERRLLERKQEALAAAGTRVSGLDQVELLEALIRAWVRFGDPSRWQPLLERLKAGGGRSARVRAIRQATQAESRLLGLAVLHFRIASQRPGLSSAEQARLNYRIGDALRRQGRFAQAAPHLRKAVQLEPDGEPARWANSLLAGD